MPPGTPKTEYEYNKLWQTIQRENPHCRYCLKSDGHKDDCDFINAPIYGHGKEWYLRTSHGQVYGPFENTKHIETLSGIKYVEPLRNPGS